MALLGSTDLPDQSLFGGIYPDVGGSAGTFFYDHTTLYPYAGLVGPDAGGSDSSLWAFNSANNTWTSVQVEGGQISFGNNSEGVYASDPRTGTSFYTGGYTVAFNGTYNGTVKFRSPNPGPLGWEFRTAVVGMQGPDILKGAMVYVRKGRAGILIAFGGYQTAYQGNQIPDSLWDQRPFNDIYIYDIYSNVWYHQTATGTIPELRTEFCAVVSSAPDDSSFQITIHGGWDQLNRRAFNDVYVLSVPSFRWIRVQDSNNPDLEGGLQPGRNRHKCDIWNETSMIVTGGEITNGTWDTSLLSYTCNPAYPPVKVLDTSTYIWQTEFRPNVTYSIPEVVTSVIGGGPLGGAQLTQPELNWESDSLAYIFSQTGPSSKSQGNDALATSAIVGIAVGAFAALAGIAGTFVAIFFSRRNRRKENQVTDRSTPSVTVVPLVQGWEKPELDATSAERYELGSENLVHEVHGEDIGKQKQIFGYR
ncbi:hypothetical protein ONZ43_g4144 [Nemania bipapillata]|uniref:Uncharacterized protein n=1 Tax=Nemania bipapillata TaxID=110536 RepID=A0ACC2IRD1_9PEZI|nr:hypothetical protein ONZ43_g4144 [Nemania bipapillata]